MDVRFSEFLQIGTSNSFKCPIFSTVSISDINQTPSKKFFLAPLYRDWLDEQSLEYKTYHRKRRMYDGGDAISYIIEFYNDEDATAFKLRWVA